MTSLFLFIERELATSDISTCFTSIDGSHYSRLIEINLAPPVLGERVVPKRRDEFYAGRWCAAKAIRKLSGKCCIPGVSSDRAPSWPEGFVGSITHTDHYAVAMVAFADQTSRVGVDLESIDDVKAADGLASQISKREEANLFADWDRGLYLALLFSAKESLFKALYPEYREYFDYLDAEAVAVDSGSITLALVNDLGEVAKRGDHFSMRYIHDQHHVFTWYVD